MPRDHQRFYINTFSKNALDGLGLAVIALQAVDAASTYLALATGKAQENNFLLVSLAENSGTTINCVVLFSKIIVAGLFFAAIRKTKPTLAALASLFFVVIFYSAIVAQNISLAINLA